MAQNDTTPTNDKRITEALQLPKGRTLLIGLAYLETLAPPMPADWQPADRAERELCRTLPALRNRLWQWEQIGTQPPGARTLALIETLLAHPHETEATL